MSKKSASKQNVSFDYEEWRGLYEAMNRIKELAPWKWMYEDNIFGIENPETKELGFVSVMGALGEYQAVSVYRGWEGYFRFLSLQEVFSKEDDPDPNYLLEVPQLMASFEDRSELTKKDLKIIKTLGFKYRGRKAWPLFRSYKPGFLPWYLESDEIRFLQYALELLFEVAPKFREDPKFLDSGDSETILIYTATRKGNELKWKQERRRIELPKPEEFNIFIDMDIMDSAKKLPVGEHEFEVDVFMYPVPIQEKRDERPYFLYIFMMVDVNSGAVANVEFLRPIPSIKNVWSQSPNKLIESFNKIGAIPKCIRVKSDLLYDLFLPLSEEFGFALKFQKELPQQSRARNSLIDFLELQDN